MKIDLSTERGCDIASAIRGLDICVHMPERDLLKHIFTERFRYMVGVCEKDACINVRKHRQITYSAHEIVAALMCVYNVDRVGLTHFIAHVHAGFYWIAQDYPDEARSLMAMCHACHDFISGLICETVNVEADTIASMQGLIDKINDLPGGM